MAGNGDSGSSNTTTTLLVMFGVGGLLLLACCGGVYWIGAKAVSKFQETMTMDPERVRTTTATIVDIHVPNEFPPFMAMDMTTFGAPMKMVFFGPQDQSRSLVLMQMIDPSGQNQMSPQQFEQAMNQQGQGQMHQVNVASSAQWVFDFGGEEYTFHMAKGTDPARNVQVRRLSGVFPGKGGAAFLSLMNSEADWDEESVLQMVESMGGQLLRKTEPGAEAAMTPGDEMSESSVDEEVLEEPTAP